MPSRFPGDFMLRPTWRTLLAAMPPSLGHAQWRGQRERRPPEACPSLASIDTKPHRAPHTPPFLSRAG